MRTRTALAAVAFLAASVPSSVELLEDGQLVCQDLLPPELEFGDPVYVDANRAGGEPVIIAAEDGSLQMSAHAGTTHAYKDPEALDGVGDFAVGYYNQTLNWRSTDGGETWTYVGLAGTEHGPHSLTSTGFSDPGYAMDGGGNLYNVEIDLANVAVFMSNDDGQSWNVANPMVSAGDRPWLTGGNDDGEAYLFVRLPRQLWRTTTHGVAWEPVVINNLPVYGQIYLDPLNPDGMLGPVSGSAADGFSMSPDDGETWTTVPGSGFSSAGDQIFAPFDLDKADGTVYMAQGNGYRGGSDSTANGYVEFNFYDREAGAWGLDEPQRLPIPEGDVLWTWLVAGEDGRVALAWYQTFPDDPDAFHLMVAQTTNAKGSVYDCDGNGEEFWPPQWRIVNASGRPIHEGAVCLDGTACNANTNFRNGDRRLGDFFQINYDRDGRLVIASGDTMLKTADGGPKPVANPIFIGQTGGAMMLEEPLETRETRCLANLPPPACL